MDLYERIKQIAKHRGISINKMEKDLGFARSYLSKLRSITPSSENLNKIAKYLDISTDILLNQKPIDYIYYIGNQNIVIESTKRNSNEDLSLIRLIDEFPETVLQILSTLCKNERIKNDATEKYVANKLEISLEDYLLFENDSKNIGEDIIINILKFWKMDISLITGYTAGLTLTLNPILENANKTIDDLTDNDNYREYLKTINELSKNLNIKNIINNSDFKTRLEEILKDNSTIIKNELPADKDNGETK
ncbi:helix-turn-helix domain-containing protein [Candidatus Galacturonibacter soehngenii]|nr:helix-turn-helix transcriptional regulator [Candidatus Galacturonibacter soehngenii]